MRTVAGNPRKSYLIILLVLSPPVSGDVTATGDFAGAPELAIGVGAGDVSGKSPDAGYGIEYRHPPMWRNLRPVVGYNATTEGDWYAYVGFRYFYRLSDLWRFDPTIAVGHFESGGGIELGGSVEFRSGFEFSRRITERARLALGFAHLSNAKIYRSNPGTETVSISVSITL